MAYEEYVERLGRSQEELQRMAAAAVASGAQTEPDPSTGQRWDAGQVLAHVAEILPYWVVQMRGLVAVGSGRPFGRTATDGARAAAIERYRNEPVESLLARIGDGIDDVLAFLKAAGEKDLAVQGLHSTIGEMSVRQILERLIVDHFEEHVEQIKSLAGTHQR